MSETYIRAASRLGWLLEQIEDELIDYQEDSIIDFNFAQRLPLSRTRMTLSDAAF